ncbi:MAG: hypothetical protein IJ501_04720 [Bacilli bacterium]|nr:hypothetical protein [Bacilli bacterium]
MKNNIEYILKIILSVFVMGVIIFVVGKLFIFLLPVILVLILLYYLYRIFFETKFKVNRNKNKNTTSNTKTKTKKIQNDTLDAEIIEEKFDK